MPWPPAELVPSLAPMSEPWRRSVGAHAPWTRNLREPFLDLLHIVGVLGPTVEPRNSPAGVRSNPNLLATTT